MPYPHEHSCRVNDPDKYERFARKNCEMKVDGKCIDVIYGITADGKSEIQAYRYPKDVWTAAAARAHCREHGGSFEAAGDAEDAAEGCIGCGERKAKSRWFALEVKNQVAEISIFDEIGGWGVPVAEFKKQFDAIRDLPQLKLLVNSPGGNVFDGMALYNLFSGVREKLRVEVLGIAASIASVVALAGRELVMGEGSYLMIHNPWAVVHGDAAEMRKVAEVLEKMRGELANIYESHSHLSKADVLARMQEETWFTAQEALEAGFADAVEDYGAIAALSFDVSKYRYQHVPRRVSELAAAAEAPVIRTEREFETFLREAGGFSRSRAEAITRKGFKAAGQGEPDDRQGEPGEASEAELVKAILRNIQLFQGVRS